MFGKSHHVAVILLVVLSTALMVPEAAFAISGPPPPSITLKFERGWSAAPKCPVEYSVKLMPNDGFQGAVNLTLTNLPKGATANIYPNPILLSYWNLAGIVFPMMIDVSPDTPNGTYKIHVAATPLPGPGSIYDKNYSRGDGYFTFVVGKCGEPLPDATTATTSTTTSTNTSTTTTVTETITRLSSLPVTDYSTYAWALSATVATVVLAAVVVLLLRRTR